MSEDTRPTYDDFRKLADRVKSLEMSLALSHFSYAKVSEIKESLPDPDGKLKSCMLCRKVIFDGAPYSEIKSFKQMDKRVYNSFICAGCLIYVESLVFGDDKE